MAQASPALEHGGAAKASLDCGGTSVVEGHACLGCASCTEHRRLVDDLTVQVLHKMISIDRARSIVDDHAALLRGLLAALALVAFAACAPIRAQRAVVTVTPASADVTDFALVRERRYAADLVEYARTRLDPPTFTVPDGVYAIDQYQQGALCYKGGDWHCAYRHFRQACLVTHSPELYRNMAYALAHYDTLSAYTFLLEYLNRTSLGEAPTEAEVADRRKVVEQATRFQRALEDGAALSETVELAGGR